MKSEKQFWYEIGQSMKLAREKRKANEREREHAEKAREEPVVTSEIAPKLRAALEKAKGSIK
ncbi:hypothetical protein [Serratia rhizosphaerae]|uniref:Uncharacterized protein n=1 Tax=Serratia rhizosphaerae TaxID=2597702 RepID=A0ABX6GTN2_9GAMM|nr:hypothetical protein [Serratia rhizosphaerae]QHA89554.1 hypothetical protein FO014_22625 [Serratia rhizosphaerae]